MALKKQMELFEPVEGAFDEGGLLQEGGSVDPISGNNVPVGSLKEEVRDDIPAQLSEGEFVMPADVVRYHGLDKMMQLRDEAKAGLARMNAMGQMGNSEEAVIPEGIPFDASNVPFDIDDIEMEDDGVVDFQVGGFVPGTQQAATSFNPAQTGVTTPVSPITGAGQFAQVQTSTPYYISQPPASSGQQAITGQQLIPQTEVRQYINDEGQIISIAFSNGQPVTPIPEGFKPYKGETTTPAAAPVASAPPPPQVDTGGDDDQQGGGFGSGATTVFGGTSRDGRLYGGTTYEVSYGRSGEGGGIPLPGLLGLATGNYDRVTLTDASGKKATMSRDLYSTLKEDRTGQQTQDIIRDLFQNTEAAERSIRESGQLDKGFLGTGIGGNRQEIENAAAKAIYDDLNIEYKGQPLSEALLVQQQAGDAGKRATPAPVVTPGATTTETTTGRTAQDDIVAESFPVTTGDARIERKPVSEIVGAMERVDAPTSPVVRSTPVETATINPFGRGEMTYAKNEFTGDWVQISGDVGQIGRTAPALQAAMMNNPDASDELVTRGTADIPALSKTSRQTGERIALPAPRPERPSRSLDLQSSFDVEAMADRDDSPAQTSFEVEAMADRDDSNQRAAERKAKETREAEKEAERFERRARTDAFNREKREAETASHQSRYESQGYSPSAARSAAVNKTDADNEARQQTNNPNASAVTSSSGKAVRSSSGRVVTNIPPDDDGGDSGGKSIVCTEMYRQTKLDDWAKAMKIWDVYQKKHLTPAHEIGYHWLFKPYVRGMQNNNLLTRLGAYLAKERTKHLKHIMTKGRAKDSLVGNVWCKFIHPIVYIAGRIKNG